MENFIPIACFVIGGVLGFVAGSLFERKKLNIPANTVVLMMVSGIWCISMLVDISSPVYETHPMVHGLMGAIVGFFYRPAGTQSRKDDK